MSHVPQSQCAEQLMRAQAELAVLGDKEGQQQSLDVAKDQQCLVDHSCIPFTAEH